MKIEERLRDLIVARYGTVANFVREIDLPYSTFKSIMTRGVMNASIGNILKICSALNISADELANGNIVPVEKITESKDVWEMIIDYRLNDRITFELDGKPLTPDEISLLSDTIEVTLGVIRRKRESADRISRYADSVAAALQEYNKESEADRKAFEIN